MSLVAGVVQQSLSMPKWVGVRCASRMPGCIVQDGSAPKLLSLTNIRAGLGHVLGQGKSGRQVVESQDRHLLESTFAPMYHKQCGATLSGTQHAAASHT